MWYDLWYGFSVESDLPSPVYVILKGVLRRLQFYLDTTVPPLVIPSCVLKSNTLKFFRSAFLTENLVQNSLLIYKSFSLPTPYILHSGSVRPPYRFVFETRSFLRPPNLVPVSVVSDFLSTLIPPGAWPPLPEMYNSTHNWHKSLMTPGCLPTGTLDISRFRDLSISSQESLWKGGLVTRL